jgi:hypothetical protein
MQIVSAPTTHTQTAVSSTTSRIPSNDIPTIFGKQDAQNGASCCPEMYFTHKADMVAYCQGYASVAGHNITTRFFLGEVAA